MIRLSGNTRVRLQTRWFRKPLLVLQVEETGTASENIGGQIDMFDVSRWRDARVEDIADFRQIDRERK